MLSQWVNRKVVDVAARQLLVVMALMLAALLPGRPEGAFRGKVQAALDSTRPNIVVIMVDDLDLNLGRALFQGGHLPNIRAHLYEAGTTFANAFVTTALCCPSRATFLTGQYSHNHHVFGNFLPTGGVSRLDDSSTVVTWLDDAGYTTALVGKYLNGYGSDESAPPTSPLNPIYVPPGYDYWQSFSPSETEMYNYRLNNNGTFQSYGDSVDDYQTDVLARIASGFIQEAEGADETPFFLIVMPTAPHSEELTTVFLPGCDHMERSRTIRPASRHAGALSGLPFPEPLSLNEPDLSDKPAAIQALPPITPAGMACLQQQYQNRAESMLAVDDLVGTVVDALTQSQELDNTVIIFTSDNGFYHGEHRLFQKVIAYEEGIRVPLLIRAPGMAPGQRANQFVLNNDLAPTIAELAGVTPGLAVDGRSLVPMLQNPAIVNWRKRFLVEYQGIVEITIPHFAAIRTAGSDLATPDQFFARWQDGSVEYYDLRSDRYQLQSEHNNPDTLVERQILEQHLTNLRGCGNGSCQLLEDQ